MANYTADDVKRLREATAAGMLDCKKALDEADGDYDKAVEIIRVKGLKGVTKREGRLTSNGLVVAKVSGETGVMLELNCETDFVAKGERFIALGDELVATLLEVKSADVAAFLAAKTAAGVTGVTGVRGATGAPCISPSSKASTSVRCAFCAAALLRWCACLALCSSDSSSA